MNPENAARVAAIFFGIAVSSSALLIFEWFTQSGRNPLLIWVTAIGLVGFVVCYKFWKASL